MNKNFQRFTKEAEVNLKNLASQVEDGTFSLEEAAMMQAGYVAKNHPHAIIDGDENFRKQRNQIALQAGIGLRPEWM